MQGQKFFTRTGEVVGNGFFIFRRGEKANRIKPGHMPYEHPTLESARTERDRLSAANPGKKYHIFSQVE